MSDSPPPTPSKGGPDDELMRSATPTPDENKHLDPQNERDLWSGRASWRSLYPPLVVWGVLSVIVLVAIAILGGEQRATLLLYAGIAAFVILVVVWLRAALRVWTTSYRITTQRLFVRRGILSQTVDQTELLRVDDVKMSQSLLQRALSIGDVTMTSSDRSDPEITLAGIDQPAQVAEHIRRHTRTVQKRTLFMENL